MPGVRIDRFLASTAAILLVAGTAGMAAAEPKFGTMSETAAPAATGAPPSATTPSTKPTETPNQSPTKPEAKAAQPVVAIVKPEDLDSTALELRGQPREETPTDPAASPAEAPVTTATRPWRGISWAC